MEDRLGGKYMKVSLKTMVSSHSEIPFLWMMFEEAANYVDRIIVTEFNQTHTGLEREFIFQDYVEDFSRSFPHLVYLQGENIPGMVRNASSTVEHHANETLMRGWFAGQLMFKKSEVIFSTDADEVLYGSTYKHVIESVGWGFKGVRFRLHQMFYRPNFLWLEQEFVAPVALRFGRYNRDHAVNWRYQGKKLPGHHGVHFSWCIPAAEMARKVERYAHANQQRHLNKAETMRQARKERSYPFDPPKPFTIRVIPYDDSILPKSFSKYRHLLSPEVLGVEGVDW